ncbi:MAG TPA: hypothetical protein DD434_04590 [Bacteroidales bacterium]|nr:hypothetical protein [Bacteroidales bacterium]
MFLGTKVWKNIQNFDFSLFKRFVISHLLTKKIIMNFNYSVSLQGYKEKITVEGFPKVTYKKKSTNEDTYLDDICEEIKSGHVFAHIYKVNNDQRFNASKNITKLNFQFTHIIPMDLDSVSITMDEIIELLKNQPTIIYTTFRHEDKVNKRRYRLLYVFNNPIIGEEEYLRVYDAIESQIYEDLKDKEVLNEKKLDINMRKCSQVFIGSKSDCDLINNYTTYDKRKFISINGSNRTMVDNVKMDEVNNSIEMTIETNKENKTITSKKTKTKTNNKLNSTKNSNSNIYNTPFLLFF